MTNSELCEAVRGLPETTGIHFCFMEAVVATDSLHDITDWQRLCRDYERLLAAAKGVREVGIISRYGKDLIAAIKECEE